MVVVGDANSTGGLEEVKIGCGKWAKAEEMMVELFFLHRDQKCGPLYVSPKSTDSLVSASTSRRSSLPYDVH